MIMRQEKTNEFKELENIIRESFWDVYQPGCDEHLVVHKLRNDKSYVKELSFVIEENGKILGFIYYSLAEIITKDNRVLKALTFGPVGVLPEYQGKGYGTILINFTLEKAKELGYPAIFITGNPDYYHRFGFVSASKFNIYLEGMDEKEEASFSMVKIFDEKWIDSIDKGVIKIAECYYCTKNEIEEFEKSFPKKEKHVKESQIR